MTLSTDLAEWSCRLAPADIPTEVMTIAKWAMIDTLGVTVAGATTSAGHVIRDWVTSRQVDKGATVVPFGLETHPETAAFAMGVLAHAHDLDDAHPSMGGHPSAVLVPVILALVPQANPSGKQALTAYVAGAETAMYLGRSIAATHYLRGWHATSTIGALAAAITAAKLLDLGPLETAHALGLAASMAAGLRINFGSDAKPLHIGQAAEHGVTSTLLSKAGLTASIDALDGPRGYLECFGGEEISDLNPISELGVHWELFDPGLNVKLYACCGAASRAIDGLIDLMGDTGIDRSDVDGVEALLSPHAADLLAFEDPKTSDEARFSLNHCLASVLVDGDLNLEHFDPAAVNRSDIREMRSRVEMGIHPELKDQKVGFAFAELRVRTKDGQQFNRRISEPRGGKGRPLTIDELETKFLNCAHHYSVDHNWTDSLKALESLDSDHELSSIIQTMRHPE